jgi:hypothetical protein
MKIKLFIIALLLVGVQLAAVAQELQQQGDSTKGEASYYNSKYHGKKTASGELYDKMKFTAAHRTLPYGTVLKVTNLRNKQSVQVRVNDRGPFKKGRIVDLSFAAASQIDMVKEGVSDVLVEVVSVPGEKKPAKPEPVVTKRKAHKKEKAKGRPEGAGKPEGTAGTGKPEGTASGKPAGAGKPEGTPAGGKSSEAGKPEGTPRGTGKPEATPRGTGKPAEGSNKPATTEEAAAAVKAAAEKAARAAKEKAAAAVEAGKEKVAGAVGTAKEKAAGVATEVRAEQANKVNPDDFKSGKSYSPWGIEKAPSGFGLQIASYEDAKKALKVAQEAASLGLTPVCVQAGWQDGKRAYRVIFGEEKTYEGAKKQSDFVRSKGFASFVRKHFE